MTLHRLKRTQVLPISLDEAWSFFSDPRNLARITPAELGFRITSELPERMYEGLFISYQIAPVLSIPMLWVTEITHIEDRVMFVDEQRMGPYRLWHHEHWFRAVPGGTEMRDFVHYAMPFGAAGEVAHALLVGRQVRGIFDYRQRILDRRFTPVRRAVDAQGFAPEAASARPNGVVRPAEGRA